MMKIRCALPVAFLAFVAIYPVANARYVIIDEKGESTLEIIEIEVEGYEPVPLRLLAKGFKERLVADGVPVDGVTIKRAVRGEYVPYSYSHIDSYALDLEISLDSERYFFNGCNMRVNRANGRFKLAYCAGLQSLSWARPLVQAEIIYISIDINELLEMERKKVIFRARKD